MIADLSLTHLPSLIAWIKENRKKAAFKDYSDWKILSCIYESIQKECFLVIAEGNKITGIVCGVINKDEKFIYIFDLIAVNTHALIEMLDVCHERFPSYKLKGKYRNKQREFKSANFLLEKL